MKWQKQYFGRISNRRIAYVSEEYRIVRTQSRNIWTGKVMSEQVWNIYFNGINIGYALTLKEAKADAEKHSQEVQA